MSGYNLPESTGPNDPEAPWNREPEEDEQAIFECHACGRIVTDTTGAGIEDHVYCLDCASKENEDDT